MFGFGLRLGIQSTGGGGPVAAPGQVMFLTAGTPTDDSVPLTWAAPSSGGAPTGYTVQYRAYPGGGSWTTFGTSADTSETVTGLTANTFYEFQVIATNGAGSGPASTPCVTLTDYSTAWQSDWTFTRAGAKTALNYSGLMQSFASGEKAQTDMGWFIEPANTNLVTSPFDMSGTGWIDFGVTVGASGELGPDGAADGQLVTATAGSSQHNRTNGNFSTTNAQAYTVSCDVKIGTAQFLQIYLGGLSSGWSTTRYANFDLVNLRMGDRGAGVVDSGFVKLANGCYRIWMSVLAVATATQNTVGVGIVPTATHGRNAVWTAAGTETFSFFGVSVTTADASACDPFSGSRVADSVTRSVAQSGDFCIFLDVIADNRNFAAGGQRRLFIWSANAGSALNFLSIQLDDNGQVQVRTDGPSPGSATNIITETTSLRWPRRYRIALKVVSNVWKLFVNGVLIGPSTTTVPTGMLYRRLGASIDGSLGQSAYFKQVADVSASTSDNDLITMTALPAYVSPEIVPFADADMTLKLPSRSYQALPGIAQVGTRLWACWIARWQLQSTGGTSAGERPGTYLVLAKKDPGDSNFVEVGYLVPNRYDSLYDQSQLMAAPDGSLWIMATKIGSCDSQEGRQGVWLHRIPDAETEETILTGVRLRDGIAMSGFKIGSDDYMAVDVWDYTSRPVQPGVTRGNFICEIDWNGQTITQVNQIVYDSSVTFAETTVAELPNGNLVSIRRTGSGIIKNICTGGLGGSWGSSAAVGVTAPSSRAVMARAASGEILLMWNNAASRTNMSVAYSTDNVPTWLGTDTFDTNTEISYPDMIIDASGNVTAIYDRERSTAVGGGAREIRTATGFTVAQLVAGTANPVVAVISDGSP